MKQLFVIMLMFSTLMILIILCGCEPTPSPPEPESSEESFNSGVKRLNYLNQPEVAIVPEVIGEENEDGLCVSKYRAALPFDWMFVLSPYTDILWPGAIWDATSIPIGEYKPITGKRGPLTISIEPIRVLPSWETVTSPTKSSIQDALNKICDRIPENINTSGELNYEIIRIYSKEYFWIALGSHFKAEGMDPDSIFRFHDKDIQSRYIVRFWQSFYSINVDTPHKPSDFFTCEMSYENLESQIDSDTSPVYLASIKYGRLGYLFIESMYDYNDTLDIIDDGLSNIITGSEGIPAEFNNLKARCITAGGGDPSNGSEIYDISSWFKEWIVQNRQFDRDKTYYPLAYLLRYLKDNSVAQIILGIEYFVKGECTAPTPTPTVTLTDEPTQDITPTPTPAPLPPIIILSCVEINGTLDMGTVVREGSPRYGEPEIESSVPCVIENNGLSVLEIQEINFTNLDFYTNKEIPFTVLPGNSEDIEFRFKPTNRGKTSSIVSIINNVPSTNPFQFKIEGIGVDVIKNEIHYTDPGSHTYTVPEEYTKYSLDLRIVGGGGIGGQGGRGGDGGLAGSDCETCKGGFGGPGGGGGGGAGGYAGELITTAYNTTGLTTLFIKVGVNDAESSVSYTNEQSELETFPALPGPTGEPGNSCWPGGADGENADCDRIPCINGSDGYDGPGGIGGGKNTPRSGGDGERGWSGGQGGFGGTGQEGPLAEYPDYGRGGNGSRGSNGGAGAEEFGKDSPPEPLIPPFPGYAGAVLITVYGYLED